MQHTEYAIRNVHQMPPLTNSNLYYARSSSRLQGREATGGGLSPVACSAFCRYAIRYTGYAMFAPPSHELPPVSHRAGAGTPAPAEGLSVGDSVDGEPVLFRRLDDSLLAQLSIVGASAVFHYPAVHHQGMGSVGGGGNPDAVVAPREV